jgi:hypothetical protein
MRRAEYQGVVYFYNEGITLPVPDLKSLFLTIWLRHLVHQCRFTCVGHTHSLQSTLLDVRQRIHHDIRTISCDE